MTRFVDRRLNGKHRSAVNRQRFLRRFKKQLKHAVSDSISKRSITDVSSGGVVTIPSKDISEPVFQFNNGGRREIVYPGNKTFVPGDKIRRQNASAKGAGSKASNTGSGTDEFGFELSREEFLDLFFDDLELPDLLKTEIKKIPSFTFKRAGITSDGIPSNINVIRSMRSALGRRIAMGAKYKEELEVLEKKLDDFMGKKSSETFEIEEHKSRVKYLNDKIDAIPFIDSFDLRYNNIKRENLPSTNAVMFCIMDVSGSMDETKKEMAKKFFILLYLFLNRNYEKIDVVFIRHHTSAKEVEEEEFFYSRETGGTVVSSSLELMHNIIQSRYPSDSWNIYAAQASDGDNWNADSPYCQELLTRRIMPCIKYFTYVEILPRHHQSLWHSYLSIKEGCQNFSMQCINSPSDIYPVFRELFKRNNL